MPPSHREYLYMGEKSVTVPIPQDKYMQEKLKMTDPVFNAILSAYSSQERTHLDGALEETEVDIEIARLGLYEAEDLTGLHERLKYYQKIRDIELRTGFKEICTWK